MRKLIALSFALLVLGFACLAQAQLPMTGAGLGKPATGGGVTFAITNQGASSYSENNTTQTVYSFATVAIGAADPNRYSVVAVGIRSTAVISISSVTVDSGGGPVSCTKVTQKDNASSNDVSLWQTNTTIPTGTTATIAVTITNAGTRAAVFAYSVVTSTGTIPSGAAISNSGVSPSVNTITVPSGGGAIIAGNQNLAAASFTPSLYTEDHDAAVAASAYIFTAGSDTTHSGSTAYSVTSSGVPSGMGSVSAAWAP